MAIDDAFLHEILAHPDDDAPRLIYADWLDEHNDPRGEFIRVQCALAQLSAEDPRRWPLEQREQELLREHEAKWLPKDIGKARCFFRRGFAERMTLLPEQFLAAGDRLFEQMPIRALHLEGRGWARMHSSYGTLAQVASSPHLTRIQRLSLSEFTLSRRELHDILASPSLRQLRELRLSRLAIGAFEHPEQRQHSLPVEIVHDLIESPCHANLVALDLTDTVLAVETLSALADSSSLPSLIELNLNGNGLTQRAANILARGRLLTQLETLHVDSNLLGDAAAVAIREWPSLPRLSRLSLRHNQIFPAGMQALAKAPALRGLISLDLFGNISCDDGAAALAYTNWTRLQALNWRFNGVGDEGVRALARSKSLSQLTWLNLTANRITNDGARALLDSTNLPRLARLDLLRNDIAAAEQERLRDRFPFVYFWPINV